MGAENPQMVSFFMLLIMVIGSFSYSCCRVMKIRLSLSKRR
jgi:hypothetical protein